ncbi:mycofactocin biosynthesis peptidyl-dipeptidase MftE [Streptomyces turgidiscabies]|uniref:Mycofactocin system creatininase family protein n=1 Tax=Streptomyces turgidiscabies (strain Car8) TaxID=698760 RepID=L7F1K6_STRT8|nr:mycofactocin biosynthesis peptidyl-dipeptidase MftE [Streptomyces turgidiscabies]ELP65167.1 mycofactocin system creatininase family protein [Streptomyces turgidiscabies Car8]MDX3494582.1 mycofactocin biosynthesis peptidyl-dipeptidase MftE [Streptomyces turgidiscabies]
MLADAVWSAVPSGALVLVPVGSTEQHGPHLPLDTDTVVARAVVRRTADALPTAWVAPPVAYGASGEHAHFPGTVSIGHEALCAVLVELTRSLSLWAGRVVFVNGHGGNTASLDTALGQLRAEGHDIAWTACETPGGDAHAGRAETSLMLHLEPERVRLDAAAVGDTRPLADLLPDLVAHGVRAVSPSGVLGDPTGACAEEGRRTLDAMVSATVRRIGAWTVDDRGRLADPARRAGTVRR